MTSAVHPAPRLDLRRLARRYPEAWVLALVAGAWVALVARAPWAVGGGVGAADASAHAHHALPSPAPGSATGAAVGVVGGTLLMVVAMMVPLALSPLRHVVRASFWARRHRAMALFLAGYVGPWALVGLGVGLAAEALVDGLGQPGAVAALFAAALAWQFSRGKRRSLARCALTIPLAPRGRAADRDCLRYGALVAASCIRSCWALMAALAATGHALVPMVAVMLVLRHERTGRRPPIRSAATLVAGVGAASVLLTALP